MKKIKLYLLLGICLLLSGCSVEYTLNIDENLNFSENVVLTENNKYFEMLNQTVDQYVETNKQFYTDNDNYKNFDYKVKKSDNSVELDAKSSKINIDDFNNYSIVYNTLFSQIYAQKDGNQIKVKTTDYDGTAFFREPYNPRDISYDKVNFTIKTPLKLISCNADEIDEEKGIYTWKFEKDGLGKNVEIILNTNVSIIDRLIIILKKYWYLLVVAIIVVVGILRLLKLNKKNNEI